MTQAAPFIRQNSRSLMVFFESFRDFCITADETTPHILPVIFKNSPGYNLYFFGCFRPGDMSNLGSDRMFLSFNEEQFCMLFGGRFTDCGITSLPGEFRSIKKPAQRYNNGIVRYRGSYHRLSMPCGEIAVEFENEDDKPIF